MKKSIWFLPILTVLALSGLVACGGTDLDIDSTISGQNAEVILGQRLFNQPTLGEAIAPGCVTCHSLEEGVVTVGPSQAGMATRAEQAIPGVSAADYLRASIVDPNGHIVEGFVEGVMYQGYETDLTEEEIDALVAYMLTLNQTN